MFVNYKNDFLRILHLKNVSLANSPENVRWLTARLHQMHQKYTLKYHLYGTQFNIYIIGFENT